MKLLITGGTGFIGSHLKESFVHPYQVVAPSRTELDLLDEDRVSAFLRQHSFDAVIHCASVRANRRIGSAPNLLQSNCRMFLNLTRNPAAYGRLLFLSSGAVYDRRYWQPRMTETYFDAHVPMDDYGFSKYICAKSAASVPNVFDLRLFGVFGPHEDWQVRFLSNACCRAVWDLPVVVRQNVIFDYLDVADLARILDWFISYSPRSREYNVCSGRTVDLVSLAQKVVKAAQKPLDIIVRTEGFGLEYSGDNSRLLNEMEGFQFRNIDDSILELYNWYLRAKDSIDRKLLAFDE